MNISICASLFDFSANFLVEADFENSDLSYVSRRVSRTATLDGKATIVDNGYTASDATFIIVLKEITNLTRLSILTMIKLHSLLTISVNHNVFLGAVESVQDKDNLKIKFLVKEQING